MGVAAQYHTSPSIFNNGPPYNPVSLFQIFDDIRANLIYGRCLNLCGRTDEGQMMFNDIYAILEATKVFLLPDERLSGINTAKDNSKYSV